jgi:hypothetical protein
MIASRTSSRIRRAVAAGICVLAFEAHAQDCTVENVDLSAALKAMPDVSAVQVSQRRDAKGDEPVLRHLVDYADGATLVMEQQNCVMHNLRVTLLSPEPMPGEAGLRRLGTVLGMAPVWPLYFSRYDPVAFAMGEPESEEFRSRKASADQFSYPVDDRLSAQDESSEVITSFMSTDSYSAQYRSVLSLYMGVGSQ